MLRLSSPLYESRTLPVLDRAVCARRNHDVADSPDRRDLRPNAASGLGRKVRQ
jgi:hypothetical protein